MQNPSLQWIEPYDFWASGDPIPMGYRDQNGTVHGPFALDYSSIRQKWFELDGEPGSPLDDDYAGAIVGQDAGGALLYERIQPFEHGYISFASGYGTTYYPYAETYLPDVRADESPNDWNSTIVVRNNGSAPATVNVTFYTGDGRVLDSRTHRAVPFKGVWNLDVRSALLDFLNQAYYQAVFEGSAIVYASQDVAVVVKTVGPQEVTGYTGFQPGSAFGFSAPGSRLYAPYAFKHYSRWHTVLRVQNAGTASTQVRVRYRNLDGTSPSGWKTVKVIPQGASLTFDPEGIGDIPANWLGSAVITSLEGQPLAAVVTSQSEVAPYRRMAYNAVSRGATNVALPLIMRHYYGFTTGFQVQNTTDNPATLTAVRYYDTAGSLVFSRLNVPLPARGAATFNQEADPLGEGFLGSVRVEATQAVAVAADQIDAANTFALDYTGFDGGNRVFHLPAFGGDPNAWWSGYIVRNVSSEPVTVTVTYYNSDGSWHEDDSIQDLAPNATWAVSSPSVTSGVTSAVLVADQDVTIIVNHRNNNNGAMAYNGCD